MSETLDQAFSFQVSACAALGAPFSSGLLECARGDLLAGGIMATLLEAWADKPTEELIREAVALRVLASLHFLVLAGEAPALAAAYPPCADDPQAAWEIARPLLAERVESVAAMLSHEPQTNEVRRAACLLGGFLTIAQETPLPLRCFELGASAGLISLWDKFSYDINGQTWGNPSVPVRLSCDWSGAAPRLDAPLSVLERHACDRRPIDVRVPEEATRLLSYCWADQAERMDRLRSAVALAQSEGVSVAAAHARDWVAHAAPMPGAASVLFHSVMWQYMPQDEQAAVLDQIHAHRAQASRDQPFYWLRMEQNEASQKMELRLLGWDRGEDRILATVHPHGASARWREDQQGS